MKICPIIDQTGTHLYDCSEIIAQCLQPLAINEYTISDTLSFPDILRENLLDSNEEYVSYDVDSLFISIPLGETIDFILDEICVRKKLKPFCKKSVSKKLLNKLCKGCNFLADGKLIIQVDGCPMGGPISGVLSNIFSVEMEFDVVKPLKPKLYKRYVDNIYSKRIKNQPDKLFEKLNNYHPNIKLTIEVNPSKFLDTEIIVKTGIIETSVVVKESKRPNHWSSAVPKKYKRNAILGDYIGKIKFQVILNLKNSVLRKNISALICQSNEHYALKFIRKLEGFTKEKYSFAIIWKTRNVRSLFNLKGKTNHVSSVKQDDHFLTFSIVFPSTGLFINLKKSILKSFFAFFFQISIRINIWFKSCFLIKLDYSMNLLSY